MIDRRGFFKSLSLLGAAAMAPSLFLPKLESVHWKKSLGKELYAPNPEWVNAPYELFFVGMYKFPPDPGSKSWQILPKENPGEGAYRVGNIPCRYVLGDDGIYEFIIPYTHLLRHEGR